MICRSRWAEQRRHGFHWFAMLVRLRFGGGGVRVRLGG